MLTPLAQPCLLIAMNSSAVPWNHVAIIRPSSCQTVRKRSQSPASRQTAQFSTSSRIRRSAFDLGVTSGHVTIVPLSLASKQLGADEQRAQRVGRLHRQHRIAGGALKRADGVGVQRANSIHSTELRLVMNR